MSVGDTAGQTLFFTASGLPAGLYINPITGLIFGTVSASAVSSSAYSVTVTASSGSSTASQTFNWTVDAAATVTLANPGDQFGNEGATINVSVSGTDSSSGTLHYAAFGLPAGLKISPSTGAITGTMAVGDAADGPYTVTVIANDGTYGASQTFAWNVSDPITITQPADQTNTEGDGPSLSISASDSSSGTLTYAAEGLPPGLKINPSSGSITGTVAAGDAADGPYSVTVIAVDGTYSNSTTFNWNVNSPITISVPDTQTNYDGDSVSQTVGATDSLSGTLTYSAQGLPPGLGINPSTGAITGTVAVGDYNIGSFFPTLLVTDGTYTATSSFEWDIGGVISISVPDGLANVVGDVLTLPIAASDSGGGTLSYAATGLPAGLSINTTTGAITGTVSSAAASVGDYATTVTASDGTNTVSGTFDWAVSPAGTVTLATPADQSTTEGASASLSLSGSGGTLRYFAEGLPPGLKINPSTGAISGTMAVGDSAYAPYTVTVIATDGTNYAEETFTWGTGGGVTMTPVADQTSNEGASVSLSLSASDSSSGTLSYSAVGLPPGLSISASTGAVTGTIALDAAAAGPYTVAVTAGDGTYSASQAFSWTISGPVTIAAVANQTDDEGDPTLTVTGTAPSGYSLTFTATDLPPGLSISSTGADTAAISGDIADGSAFLGTYTVTVTANDGTNSASSTFTWTVDNPITIDAPAELEDSAGQTIVPVTITAANAYGATLEYDASNLPPGLSINSSTGKIIGTVSEGLDAGVYDVFITVTDHTYTNTTEFYWAITNQTLGADSEESYEAVPPVGVTVSASTGLNVNHLPGAPIGVVDNFTDNLTSPNRLPFGGGTANVTADVESYMYMGKPTKFASFTVTADPMGAAAMPDAHWVQFVKVDRYSALRPLGMSLMQNNPLTEAALMNLAGKGLMLDDDSAPAVYVGQGLTYNPGKFVVPAGRPPVSYGLFLMQDNPLTEAALAILTAPQYYYTWNNLGTWSLDSATESPYTEIGGAYQSTPTSLTLVDNPSYPVDAQYPLAIQSFQLYLVVNGLAVYEINWSATTIYNAPIGGIPQPPTSYYTVDSGSQPTQLPNYVTGPTLMNGYTDFINGQLVHPITYLNPIKGIAK